MKKIIKTTYVYTVLAERTFETIEDAIKAVATRGARVVGDVTGETMVIVPPGEVAKNLKELGADGDFFCDY